MATPPLVPGRPTASRQLSLGGYFFPAFPFLLLVAHAFLLVALAPTQPAAPPRLTLPFQTPSGADILTTTAPARISTLEPLPVVISS